ncbi:hypothetical protein F5148DRAFT_1337111 [Russula earlei]|uniref:Uncharacterized protein n=1 Tax=Russula earlei TaxID=71964 RepID=A0ACC0UFI6_9AGAM|nr:hypothetical protein F5148DRAFT_1337111 [Russula earlei]
MTHCLSTAFRLPSVARFGRSTPSPAGNSGSNHTSIHILDDDSLLNIFYLHRPILLDADEVRNDRILQGGVWDRERWWYKLAHVCQRWRYLILASASYLQLSLVCTYGTPVADMLAHSPRLPLVIDHVSKDRRILAEDEERILLALQYRDRVRRIRLLMPIANLQNLATAIDDEFPMLEFLYVEAQTEDDDTSVKLPKTLRAPRLCHLISINFDFLLGSPLLTTPAGLVTLSLQKIHRSASFRPIDLVQRLSLMPQLETLGIHFHPPPDNRDIEGELLDTRITTHAALPNLRWFGFGGASAYLEALLPRLTTPLLEKLQLRFTNQSTFSIPRLLQFMSKAKNLRLSSTRFIFYSWGVAVMVYPYDGAKMYTLEMKVVCRHLDAQVSSVAQIFDELSPAFSAVEYFILENAKVRPLSERRLNEVDRTQWRKLLRSFGNVKTLLVDSEFVEDLSRCLRSEDGEPTMELLPELKELSYFGKVGAFAGFIVARHVTGRPVNLLRHQNRFAFS